MKVHLGVYRETGSMFKVRNALVRSVYCDTECTTCNLAFLSERMLYVCCVVTYEYHNRQTDKGTQI